MSSDRRASQRDETLVRVLERLADSISAQEIMLKDTMKQQIELLEEMERSEKRQVVRQSESVWATEKSSEEIGRYRSDMLSLVNEQDRLNVITLELSKKHSAMAFTLDNINNLLNELNDRIEIQEKLVNAVAYSQEDSSNAIDQLGMRLETQERVVFEINAHSVRHEELLPKEIGDLGRNVNRLHADTEKHLVDMHRETQRQLERLRMDIDRRLLALDKIEASLEILLVRTEPPEKKPFFIIRIYRALRMKIENNRLARQEKKYRNTNENNDMNSINAISIINRIDTNNNAVVENDINEVHDIGTAEQDYVEQNVDDNADNNNNNNNDVKK